MCSVLVCNVTVRAAAVRTWRSWRPRCALLLCALVPSLLRLVLTFLFHVVCFLPSLSFVCFRVALSLFATSSVQRCALKYYISSLLSYITLCRNAFFVCTCCCIASCPDSSYTTFCCNAFFVCTFFPTVTVLDQSFLSL